MAELPERMQIASQGAVDMSGQPIIAEVGSPTVENPGYKVEIAVNHVYPDGSHWANPVDLTEGTESAAHFLASAENLAWLVIYIQAVVEIRHSPEVERLRRHHPVGQDAFVMHGVRTRIAPT